MYSKAKQTKQAFLLMIIALSLCSCDLFKNETPFPDMLAGNIRSPTNQQLSDADLLKHDLILLYFSAHWCPPCQKFTPVLVNFYNDRKGGKNFETLLISSDHSEADMQNYIRQTRMPWPAIRYRSESAKALGQRYGGGGIPRLVLINNKGKILADSYEGRKYVGPGAVLTQLEKLLTDKTPAPKTETTRTQPDNAPPPPLTEQLKKKYKINGLGQGAAGNMAIINNTPHETGDELEPGVIILHIHHDHVEIFAKGQKYKLYPDIL
jgi:thiol-disulfide isomerase/thioredoxin